MFSGIVECLGRVVEVRTEGTNKDFIIESPLFDRLKIDQSVAHNGVCLTVVELRDGLHRVTAIEETLIKSNLGELKSGDMVNLELAMKMDGMLDGHIVQGHVDTTALCTQISECEGSKYYTFEYEASKAEYITVEKGSVCVNGVSLTVVDPSVGRFSVAIIPYTEQHTNFHCFEVGSRVNIEFDILGKYILKYMSAYVQSAK
ncbi:MAG: riboflavin synthase [Rikenellaceae bacterium]